MTDYVVGLGGPRPSMSGSWTPGLCPQSEDSPHEVGSFRLVGESEPLRGGKAERFVVARKQDPDHTPRMSHVFSNRFFSTLVPLLIVVCSVWSLETLWAVEKDREGVASDPVQSSPDMTNKEAARYWPQWRGPLGTGVAPLADPPIEWSETKNIRWKIALPGKGHSTPIIWGDRLFVTMAVPCGPALPPKYSGVPGGHDEVAVTNRQRFNVVAVNRSDGKILWERTLREDLPHQGGHVTASLASPSPVTDGEHLYVSFGSWGLYCLDLDGTVLWEKDLGQLNILHGHGEGSSPAVQGDTVIVNWDHEGESFLVAFDKHTGKTRWKTARERASSWTTPIVTPVENRAQVIVSGSERLRGYDLDTGTMIWECAGLSVENVVSSPVAGNGMVFGGSTYDRPGMLAIRLDGAQGDLTGTKRVVWRRNQGAPYVPSPLLYGDALYFLYHFQGILTRVNAWSGKDQPGSIRLPGVRNVFASPVAASGRVYVTSREGITLVLRDGDELAPIAENRLDDTFNASAAIAGYELFLRGEQFLYCIASKRGPD